MKLYREYPKPDPQKIHESLKKATGSKHPENIHGYQMFFAGGCDVWISDAVAEWLTRTGFRDFLDDCISRWRALDDGEVSNDTGQINCEAVWLGNGKPLYGIYTYVPGEKSEQRLKFRNNYGYDYVSFEWEYDLPRNTKPKEAKNA